jgi:hypothetical protein
MKIFQPIPGRVAFHTVLILAVLAIWCLSAPYDAFADDPPTPPPAPPTSTYTPIPEDPTDTPEPSDTPEPTDTSVPTDTPVPTDTAVPTATPMPVQTAVPTETPPGPVETTGPQPTSNSRADCQSVVSGSVFTLSGRPAAGATVLIEGTDWSDAMLTDDAGQYSFNQLCPGKASVQAYLADGQVSQLAELDLNGRDPVEVALSVAAAGAVVAEATSEQTPTPEPDMPVTGYAGWLLVGGAGLAVFLLLVAGTRRAITVRERSGGRD